MVPGGRPADELLTLYVLERFLYRLSVSAYRDRLILKGGMLLSAFGQRRPTRDIDLLAKATSNEPAAVAMLVREIAAVEADDGVTYDTDQMTTRMIREQDLYAAVRVATPARADRARHPLRIDVNVGDPVRAGLEGLLPPDYTEAIRHVTVFSDPVITGSVTSGHWDHQRTHWTT